MTDHMQLRLTKTASAHDLNSKGYEGDVENALPVPKSGHVHEANASSVGPKIFAALFYAISSFFVLFVNKYVLTNYGFKSPNTLALLQFLFTASVLQACAFLGKIKIAKLSKEIFIAFGPLSLFFAANIVSGLSGTERISIPNFTVLRRFSIVMTMGLEYYFGQSKPSYVIVGSVIMMVLGAVVAAWGDLSFDPVGYGYILLNDLFTALYGVVLKWASTKAATNPAITGSSKDADSYDEKSGDGKPNASNIALNKWSLLYYNSLFSFFLLLTIVLTFTNDIDYVRAHPAWSLPSFLPILLLSASMGSILNYAIYLCTHLNSALTTTVIGCLKNVLSSYIGMVGAVGGGDYIFSWLNFAGINVSIVGSLVYSYEKFKFSSGGTSSSGSSGGSSTNGNSSASGSSSSSSSIPGPAEERSRLEPPNLGTHRKTIV